MKVTLHEVAARAGVSIATVSRALNGLPVAQANLARVREAVAELGYVANDAARALRSERSMTMGLIFFDLRNMLGIDLLDALSDTIEEAGYSLMIGAAQGDARRFDLLMNRFLERRVDAMFCIGPPRRMESLARSGAGKAPVMTLFGAGGAAELPNISPSMAAPAKALAGHLGALGHTRVAVIQGEPRNMAMKAIGEGLAAAGLAVETVEPSEELGAAEVMRGLIARRDRPTAILASGRAVRGLMAACAGLGLETPREMSFVALNDVGSDAQAQKAGISSIAIDPRRMGQAAGAAMLAWLAGARPADRTAVETASFVARASTAEAPSI